jgi:hypothetical protein
MDVLTAVQHFLRQMIDRLSLLLQQASPGTLQLTGVLGLAAAIVAYYQLRGGNRDNRPRLGTSQPSAPVDRARVAASEAFGEQQPQQLGHPADETLSTLQKHIYTKLKGKRTITLTTPGVLLLQSTPDELQEGAEVVAGIPELVHEMAKVVDLYLITRIVDDIGQAAVLGALEASGVVGDGLGAVKPHRVLFCSSPEGVVSMVRQIEPDLHVDSSSATISDLKRFMPRLLHIAPDGSGAVQANVESAKSLHLFFELE